MLNTVDIIGRGIDRHFWIDSGGKIWGAIGRSLADELRWNGVAKAGNRFWDRPSWLPIALLCCEADADIGPGFASAILDAGADDAAARIAADWLEERGIMAETDPWKAGEGDILEGLESLPEGWLVDAGDNIARGPLHSWCRNLIDTRCVACGGHRDGDDPISYLWPAGNETDRPPALYRAATTRRIAKGIRVDEEKYKTFRRFLIAPDCLDCGFPRHLDPPAALIPAIAAGPP